MELNDTITLSGEVHFCDKGNRLARKYLDTCNEALRMIYEPEASDTYYTANIEYQWKLLRGHVIDCESCRKG